VVIISLVGSVLRVLVIDDDADLRFIVGHVLDADVRFEVVGEAPDGRTAIELADSLQPDIVLLDLEMPWLDGAEALPHIRRVAPDAVVIIWTVAPYSARANDAHELGATAVLDKALYTPRELPTRLASLDLRSATLMARTRSPGS
jgi:two-component system chemotaxis response regulator CheB